MLDNCSGKEDNPDSRAAMDSSNYFEQTLFFDQSPAAGEHFARASESIFETKPRRSYVDARIYEPSGLFSSAQSAHDVSHDTPAKEVTTVPDSVHSSPRKEYDLMDGHVSDSSTNSSTCQTPGVDQARGKRPPQYHREPKPIEQRITSSVELEAIVKDTRNELRIFLLRQRHSYSRVQVSSELFETLLATCHVFPRFKEFMIGFGVKQTENDIGPPPIRFKPLRNNHNAYRGFECAYTLRYVELTKRAQKHPWSLRQTTIYHRYKSPQSQPGSTWILVGTSDRAEKRLDQYTRGIQRPMESNPFELHVIFIDTAIASWRPYLADLSTKVTDHSNRALLAMIEDTDQIKFVEIDDHQELKQVQDTITDIMLSLDSTLDTLRTLLEMYEHFRMQALGNPDPSPVYGNDAVIFAFRQKIKEVEYLQKKGKALISKIQSTRSLISDILKRQSTYTLGVIEKETHRESSIMRELAEKGRQDSSVIRVLSIITLFYLPSTIVSSFYSTQFVNQELRGGVTTVVYSKNWWLFFAISGPLTAATLAIWYFWSHWSISLTASRRKGDNPWLVHRNNTDAGFKQNFWSYILFNFQSKKRRNRRDQPSFADGSII